MLFSKTILHYYMNSAVPLIKNNYSLFIKSTTIIKIGCAFKVCYYLVARL